MRHIHVTCAIIEKKGTVLAAQRSELMSMPLKWEFPGGKIDGDETPEACIKRELVEELGITVAINKKMAPVTHRYPSFVITLHPFICSITSGEPVLTEHKAVQWLSPAELLLLDWAEADVPVAASYLNQQSGE